MQPSLQIRHIWPPLQALNLLLRTQQETHPPTATLMRFQRLPAGIALENPDVVVVIQALQHQKRIRPRLLPLRMRRHGRQLRQNSIACGPGRTHDLGVVDDRALFSGPGFIKEPGGLGEVREVETGGHAWRSGFEEGSHALGVEMCVVEVLEE